MKNRVLSILFFVLMAFLMACEDIYQAKIDVVENVITVDARIVYGSNENYIKLYKSESFNNNGYGTTSLGGATVDLIDNNNAEYSLPETSKGNFKVNFSINPDMQYKLRIVYNGDTYESTFESIPVIPTIDSIYGTGDVKVVDVGGANTVSDFQPREGFQFYIDAGAKNDLKYYRFGGRVVLQYSFQVQVGPMEETMYAWKSFNAIESFNIAAPPEYSDVKTISRHPAFFLQKNMVNLGETFRGWIVILYQYGLSESAYNYYNDLNSQLHAEGKIFDPLYVQARNNLKCTNNPEQLIFGNFEISSVKETRYYINFISIDKPVYLKPIPYFYNISDRGEQLTFPPDFWEVPSKIYP